MDIGNSYINTIENNKIKYFKSLEVGTRVVGYSLINNPELNGLQGTVQKCFFGSCVKYIVLFNGRNVIISCKNIKCVDEDMCWFSYSEHIFPDLTVRYTPEGFYVKSEWLKHTLRESSIWNQSVT